MDAYIINQKFYESQEVYPVPIDGATVLGQLVFTFAATPTPAELAAAGAKRDALVARLTTATAALFAASAFPGTTVSNTSFWSTVVPYSHPDFISWNYSSIYPSDVGHFVDQSPGAEPCTVAVPGLLTQSMSMIDAGGASDLIGIDTGKHCASNITPTPGAWAPACDQPQSPNFPKVWVTQSGYGGVAFTGPAANAVASGAHACPLCYTAGGQVQAWSYSGPNRGKYCTKRSVVGALDALAVRDEVEAYSDATSCVAVGVWTPTAGFTTIGPDAVYVPSGSMGSLCARMSGASHWCGGGWRFCGHVRTHPWLPPSRRGSSRA
jgi:hypothetical protein